MADVHTGEACGGGAEPPAPPPPPPLVSLLDAAELSSRLQGDDPPLVLEAVMGPSSTGRAFIPGAVLFSLSHIDVYDEDATGAPLPTACNYNLKDATELRSALERHGIHAERRCVVYTQCRRHTTVGSNSGDLRERGHHHRYRPATSREGVADVIVAARLVWALAYAGVERVALLDGGLSGWSASGLSTVPAPAPPRAVDDFSAGRGGPFPRHPELCASVEEVVAAVAAAEAPAAAAVAAASTRGDADDGSGSGRGATTLLGDARAWGEFCGEGHDYCYALPQRQLVSTAVHPA